MNSLTVQIINREKIIGRWHREEQWTTMKICDKRKEEGQGGPETKMEKKNFIVFNVYSKGTLFLWWSLKTNYLSVS